MAKFHLNRDRQSLGQFTPQEVADGLRDGKFLPTDLVWREGMESWQALSSITDLPPPLEVADASLEPVAEGTPALPVTAPTETGTVEPAWERRAALGFFPALIETLRQVLLEPGATFSVMKREGGISSPLIYWLIMGTATGIVVKLYNFALIHGGQSYLPASFPGVPSAEWATIKSQLAAQTPVNLILSLLLTPVGVLIGAFIGSGINHLCLMIVGGANKPFEVTFRALAYAVGSSSLLLLLPGCGGLIYIVWALVVSIIALQRAHECATWKAALGVLLPVLVCCFCIAGIAAMAGFSAASLMSHH